MTTTKERVSTVLRRLADFVDNSSSTEEDANVLSRYLDNMLDDLHSEDFFGTEGQLDPRGDQRDGFWHMKRVQGIDPR